MLGTRPECSVWIRPERSEGFSNRSGDTFYSLLCGVFTDEYTERLTEEWYPVCGRKYFYLVLYFVVTFDEMWLYDLFLAKTPTIGEIGRG